MGVVLRWAMRSAADLDSKFLTAYWLPAFVAVPRRLRVLVAVVGFLQVSRPCSILAEQVLAA